MQPVDVITKYAGAEIGVLLQHREKHAGEMAAVYWMDYPSIEYALEAVAHDLFDGMVERMTADGQEVPDEDLRALTNLEP